MKKTILVLFLLTIAIAVFAQTPTAVIREITGTVELKRANAANWTVARVGETVARSTIISTGLRSSATITVGSSTIMVRPLTRLSFEDLQRQGETETINVSLSAGRMRVEVQPPSGAKADFKVSMPTTTASVRGTAFEINPVHIGVTNGTVEYSGLMGSGITVQVREGQNSKVDESSGNPIHPFVMAEMERNLPSLPGEEARSPFGAGGGMGTFNADIKLTPAIPIDITITINPN